MMYMKRCRGGKTAAQSYKCAEIASEGAWPKKPIFLAPGPFLTSDTSILMLVMRFGARLDESAAILMQTSEIGPLGLFWGEKKYFFIEKKYLMFGIFFTLGLITRYYTHFLSIFLHIHIKIMYMKRCSGGKTVAHSYKCAKIALDVSKNSKTGIFRV